MRRITAYIPIIVLLWLLTGCTTATMQPVATMATGTAGQQDGHTGAIKPASDHQQGVATLSDARNIYRICNTRPQRLLPSNASKQEDSQGRPMLMMARCPAHQHLMTHYDGRRRTETAPFRSSASCLYYVIALRRILR